MRLRGCLLLLVAGFATGASAQEGIYVGLGLGSFDYEESSLDPILGRVSDTVSAYKLFGGFEFSDYIGIEVSYGETETSELTGSTVIDPFGEVSLTLTTDFTITSVRAIGQLPLEWGALLGGLGYFSSDEDFTENAFADCCGTASGGGSISNDGLTAMLGVEWRFGRFGTRYGFRLEYEWWDIEALDASAIGLAFSYGF